MSSLLLYHHLGLGDHIILNGLVRHYAKRYERIGLFAKPHNFVSVAFMYRDLPNLSVIPADDRTAERLIFWNRLTLGMRRYDQVIRIGFNNLNRGNGLQFEEQFYQQACLPLSALWDNFYVQRDPAREDALTQKIGLPPTYIFVHEDSARRYTIERERIPAGLTVFTPEKSFTENIFDYCGIIERAHEIHVIDSSFMFQIDCLPYRTAGQKLFVHRYARVN